MSANAQRNVHSNSPMLTPYEEKDNEEKFQVKVHSELVADLDFDHAKALDIPLRDCTDEQLIVELARRKVDIQHRVTSELVTKYYHFEKLLGHGASGQVYLVYHRESGEKFACKVIKKDGSMNDAQSMSTEIEIMKRCRHAHIVSLYELFESSSMSLSSFIHSFIHSIIMCLSLTSFVRSFTDSLLLPITLHLPSG